MMFSLRTFLMEGLKDAVGKLPDYLIILNAAGWLEKAVLTEEDLQSIQILIAEKNAVAEAAADDTDESG